MELKQAVEELRIINKQLERLVKLRALRRILKIFLIGFFLGKDVDKKLGELTTRNDSILGGLKDQCVHTSEANSGQVKDIENSGTYLTHDRREQIEISLDSYDNDLSYLDKNGVLEREFISAQRKELEKHRQIIQSYNKDFIERRKREYSYLWNKGLCVLDEEQQEAIITDDKFNVVLAAAGSGKTETLITRIEYLIARKPDGIEPSRVLAIAYQNKDVKQIEQRLSSYGIHEANVKTFHKLGLDILKRAGRLKNITILDPNERPRLVRRLYEDKLKNDAICYHAFLGYLQSLHEAEQSKGSIGREADLAIMKLLTYVSIDNTRVKSRAEKEILDFFLTSKLNEGLVETKYEPEISELGKPDFHLPKYDLFIEHWAIDEKGEIPAWFDQSAEDYKENMERKRRWFAENNKLLVETFSYEYDENSPDEFIELLKRRVADKLKEKYNSSFEFTPMTYDEVVKVVWKPDRDRVSVDRVSRDIFNFIKNAKIYNITPDRMVQKIASGRYSRKQFYFGNLAARVYQSYEEELRNLRKIDFEDMINEAVDALADEETLFANAYDYILVDEYQDISLQRYKLLGKLLEHNPSCKLFCVGDDWQSIMGFAGSNLDFIVNFDKYFRSPAETKISTNYRSCGTIVDAGAKLVGNNHSCQRLKKTVSSRTRGNAIKVCRSPHKEKYRERYYLQITEDCLSRISSYLGKGYAPKDILVLCRFMHPYSHNGEEFHHIIKAFSQKAQEMQIRIAFDAKSQTKVRLLTVHKSKGLEAKVVFILNVIKDLYGFPCEIEDSSLYAPAKENYPLQEHTEEERRLFYVAMTRAKDDLIIYTWEHAESQFLDEIRAYIEEERLNY
jgi:DNA helicase-4